MRGPFCATPLIAVYVGAGGTDIDEPPPPAQAVNAMLAAIKAPHKTIALAGIPFTCLLLAGTMSIHMRRIRSLSVDYALFTIGE